MSLDVTGIEEQTRTATENSLRVFPNPVAGRATFSYSLPRGAPVSCIVYDAAGNIVSRLSAGTQPAGEHQLTWNPSGATPGVFFCKLQAGNSSSTVRLALVR